MLVVDILRLPTLAVAIGMNVGCTLSMGTVSDVQINRVSFADVDRHGLQRGCCGNMHWLRVDFVSDTDYSDRARRGIPVWVHYGWCPLTDKSSFAVSALLTSQGRVDSGTTLTPLTGEAKHRRYAYHAFLPESSPARRQLIPGESDGAYDVRKASGDFCVAVRGGEMWTGRHGQSKGGVVRKAVLADVLGL